MKPKTLISVDDAKEAIASWKSAGKKVALVPTMGALHEGHLSLVRKAKELADVVVVSIFVNPTQFGPSEDFAKYPRTLKDDLKILEALEVDCVFAPTANEIYPQDFQTWISNDLMSNQLCGASRSGHFRGVCTVVLKFLNIICPDFGLFGKKDYQQFNVLKRMTNDLNMDVELVGCEIVRDSDGLAMSSRNRNLSDVDRETAVKISQSINAVADSFNAGERDVENLNQVFLKVIADHPQIEVEYSEFRTQNELQEYGVKIDSPCVFLVAIQISGIRLIDNIELGTYEFV